MGDKLSLIKKIPHKEENMKHRGKNYKSVKEKIEKNKSYEKTEAIKSENSVSFGRNVVFNGLNFAT